MKTICRLRKRDEQITNQVNFEILIHRVGHVLIGKRTTKVC